MTEAAVMIAFALHLLSEGATDVKIHPDGEHGKAFDIKGCLEAHHFQLTEKLGSTNYGGHYCRDQQSITVTLVPGVGDVEAQIGGKTLVAECKGGIINTRHPGQVSRLRRGLCETIGLLMARSLNGERQVAVVPTTEVTANLARRMLPRARTAGIEIALVAEDGQVVFLD
jgi:hypothetical protein